ncbi:MULTISPECIES: DUF3084 domain-containing protein [unclassified Coleofasciculus]|uniref:DUF3084 domain-containing protein n=1 Tax=unclassified Coleofasciculus TaxID=2692782 RepID=UPI001882751B|nr:MULTISPECIES: DUF3084 domain-containing protein [unclassified Coleofasciculus]MBE9129418.1 DUF3084 domain-containing protein [Coleofasciculus sp. LEGE 07081]MBE9152035.1 DUF3084 domain-containing protein [Coleofasciculus sp. LEGE 07092]
MTSAYILIVAILLLGGVLATLGDRIGTKVGKARLSLFNLRPRKTATVVTIITGCLISASTLGILFGLSESLREGVFQLDNILKTLRHTRAEVESIDAEKAQVEGELAKTRTEQKTVEKRLDAINRDFQEAQAQLKDVSRQATVLRSEIKSLLTERQELLKEREQLKQEIAQIREIVVQRDQELEAKNQQLAQKNQQLTEKEQQLAQKNQQLTEKEQQLAQKNQQLTEKEQQLAQKDEVIAEIAQREIRLKDAVTQRESRLLELEQELTEREKQLAFLERQVEVLEQYYQNYQALRQGNVALLRGQVLAFGVVRIVEPSAATQAIDQLLREANRTASEVIQPRNTEFQEPLVQITETQANQLINQIKDGQDYVIRILSAANYVVGEKPIQVFADAAVNQVVFEEGDILAAISTDTTIMTDEQVQQRIDQLLAASQFRARRAGVLGKIQVGDGSPAPIVRFIEQLEEYDVPLEIKAVAQEETYAAGPLKIQLVVTQNGRVIFST